MQRILETKGKLLGIDFGDKRTGLAVSDVTRFLASGIGYISVGGMQKTAARVCEIIKEENITGGIVIGLPVNMNGSEGISGQWSISVSNEQVDEDYNCWCNHDCNGNISPHFYTSIYNVTGTSKFRSLSGVTCTPEKGCGHTTIYEEQARAKANNTTDNVEWFTSTYSMFELIYALLIMVGKCAAVQYVFGEGLLNSGINDYVSGTANDKGLFYGDVSYNNKPVKIFGMENWYGYKWDRLAGLYAFQYKFWCKKTWNTEDGTGTVGYPPDSYATAGFIDITPNSGVPSYYRGYITQYMGSPHGIVPRFTAEYDSHISGFYAQHHEYYGSYYDYSTGYEEGMVGGPSLDGNYGMYSGVGWSFVISGSGYDYSSTRLTCIPTAST